MQCPSVNGHAIVRAILLAFCFFLAGTRHPFADFGTGAFAGRAFAQCDSVTVSLSQQLPSTFIINPSISNQFLLYNNVDK